MGDFGIPVRYHHHEVGAQGQQEIEGWFADLLTTGDHAVLTKYILFNLAERHGLKVTFMPKPLLDNAGSGWHLHQFLTKDGQNIFNDDDGYAESVARRPCTTSGGILNHADALCAFTNPSTNSFKRLVPGFEAPTVRTFGRSNRGAAIRIPSYVTDPQLRRIEYRPPDLTANPYLCCAAILMAGLDGIINRIDPIEAGLRPRGRAQRRRPARGLPAPLPGRRPGRPGGRPPVPAAGRRLPRGADPALAGDQAGRDQRHQPAAASLRVHHVLRFLITRQERPCGKSRCSTAGRTDFVDLTVEVQAAVTELGLERGRRGGLQSPHHRRGDDQRGRRPGRGPGHDRALDRIVPWQDGYRHAEGNAAAHIKASLFGSSVTVIVSQAEVCSWGPGRRSGSAISTDPAAPDLGAAPCLPGH